MEDHKVRIPYDPKIRAALREVTKQTTAAGNIRFTAERTADGHADEFWALGLAIHAASGLVDMPIDYQSAGTRTQLNDYVSTPGGIIVPHGFGAVRGNNDFGGY
ncbi:hypothetical protein ACIUWX_29415 [Pseudomonas aeruginosa]